MSEVLVQFDADLADAGGRIYTARVCGREAEDRLWEGWVEFHPRDGAPVLRTPRETRQPNRTDLEYWATGLTVAYLEGALERALHPRTPDLRPRAAPARPAPSAAEADPAGRGLRPHAVLDPFHVYAQGEDVLREELGALDEGHLRNIVRAHNLVGEEEMDLQALGRAALAEIIVAAVRRRAG
jgi:hypothetical protein